MPDFRPVITVRDFLLNSAGLEKLFLGSANFPWYLSPFTVDENYIVKNFRDGGQFTHMLVHNGEVKSSMAGEVLGMFNWDLIERYIGPDYKLDRAKANLLVRTNPPLVHPPHVDSQSACVTMLYYVNDSDGDTVLYSDGAPNYYSGAPISFTSAPERGKAIIFDGRQYHSSTTPSISDYRAVINMVFKRQ